ISSTKYYKDESCWNADVKSKTTEDIISNRSFMEALVLNHYVLAKNVFEQNGYVERLNRHVVEIGLTFLAQACVPRHFLLYAFDTVVYLINRMPSRTSINRAGLSNCNPMSSLMVTSSSLSLDDNIAFSNPVKYRHVVGALQYVTLSRPDIAFDVNKMLNRIGIQMIDGPLWFAIYLGSNLISRTTRKQRMVSRSFTEAEYKALPDMDSSTSS
nr:hypothetical protein [Tanacetum cinerariifolium]